MNTFKFSGKAKRTLLLIMLAGAVLIGIGALTFSAGDKGSHGHDDGHGQEVHGQQEHVDHAVKDLKNAADDAEVAVEKTAQDAVDHAKDAAHEAVGHDDGNHEAHGDEGSHEAHGEGHGDHDGHGHADRGHGDEAHGNHNAHAEKPVTLKAVIATNLWAVIQFFFWIGFTAFFFLAAHTAGWSGWHIQVQKLLLSFTALFPFLLIVGALVFLWGKHDIFEWTHLYLFDEGDARFDKLLKGKQAFLNVKVFTILSFIMLGTLLFLALRWRKNFNAQDGVSRKHFHSIRNLAAGTIVALAVINAFGVWSWVMSVEPHWYSTLYAWYTAASACAAMLSFTILIVLFLKSEGYLPNVNDNHLHDLGKYLFAISVFWTYLWFSQYMLIWYANIPEETIYFKNRMTDYPFLFFAAFGINFVLAFLVLLKRVTKRNVGVLMFMCVMLIIGHWFDFFNMIVTPNVKHSGMGLIAFGSLLLFSGGAMFIVLSALTRWKSLDSREHPYYQESVKHHI